MLVVDRLGVQAASVAHEAEEQGNLSPETVRLLREAGFARHFVPREFGGLEGTFGELAGAVAAVGASCPATAWCASLIANLGRMIAFLPDEGQREIWQHGPDPLVVGSLASFGEAVADPDGDGWVVSGRWPYISGVDHADWALLCATLPDGEPERVFAVPAAALKVERSWDSIGMRATGSHDVSVQDLRVPARLTFSRDDVLAGRPARSTAACHTVPLEAANLVFFALPILGTAQGALALWTEYARGKAANWNPAAPSAAALATTYARAEGEIDAARMLLERCAEVCDRGAAVTPEETSRNMRDAALAVELLTEAVQRLVRKGGTANFGGRRPLQRFWRDANGAASHVALQFELSALGYAEGRLWEPGKAPGSSPVGGDW
ncbi:acyl-CoA dehydrogenase family protein [Streptomyces rubiginosohelvolus]|uniref:acyl-CoA dehydrogenase family protein n=1 Tax=Streptomyces rubiginosohelvolus TaxID=67362 RepID=UPI0035DF11EB